MRRADTIHHIGFKKAPPIFIGNRIATGRLMTKSNKGSALEVLKRTFIERDPTVVEQYFGKYCKQHNPVIPDGPSVIAAMIPTLTSLAYEPGMAVGDGELVMVDWRYTGWGPKPMVAVDIFRIAKLARW
jgi:predicted SnoaL-like aldol condensation-catalyzing enzyme